MDALPFLQAMTAPAVFFSGRGLVLLSLNARMLAIFSRVRSLHEQEESEATAHLLAALNLRARRIRDAFVAALLGTAACLASCPQMALGVFWPPASWSGLVTLTLGVLALLTGIGFYLLEVLVAVPSLELHRSQERRRRRWDDPLPGSDRPGTPSP